MQQRKYGDLPFKVRSIKLPFKEMMFYQYLPVKLIDGKFQCEKRLMFLYPLLDHVFYDFLKTYGIAEFSKHNIYLTVKYMFKTSSGSFNRLGWHSDGFMTEDINYIWSDRFPTIYNISEFKLTQDDRISLEEMNLQALMYNDKKCEENMIYRLDQFVIHKVQETTRSGMRAFVKVSFSKDRYDLVGNSHNYELDYDWPMKEREIERNIPQSNIILP